VPIYDQGYRRYQARGPLRRIRFWPITREALRMLLARRAFLLLLVGCWVHLVVRVIQIYVVTRFPEASRVLPIDGRLFGEFLNIQLGFGILLSIFGGAGLIANDLRTGAILVYLSRPLSRRDYVIGKLSVLLALNLSVTLVPALCLYSVGLALAPGQYAQWKLLWIGPAILLYGTLESLVVSLIALAVSALSRSARIAGIGFFGLLAGLDLTQLGLWLMLRDRATALVSVRSDLQLLGNALFGIKDAALSVHWGLAALVLALVSAGCLAVLRARVRAVEIVR
jgi:ABC-2 type transport system permease protein